MALVPARITNLVWDTVKGTLVLNVVAADAPPPPQDGGMYTEPTGSQLSFEVPVRKATTEAPTMVKIETSPQGFVWTRYTWNGSAWVNPVRVDEAGNPI